MRLRGGLYLGPTAPSHIRSEHTKRVERRPLPDVQIYHEADAQVPEMTNTRRVEQTTYVPQRTIVVGGFEDGVDGPRLERPKERLDGVCVEGEV